MARRVKVHLATAADPVAVRSLLSSIVVLILKLTGQDTTPLKTDFSNWVTNSSSLLTQMGIKKEYTRIANILKVKGEFFDEDAIELGKLLNKNKGAFERDASISYEELALFKKFITYLRSDSAPAWKYIEKNITVLGNAKLNSYFVGKEEELASTYKTVEQAVKKMQLIATKLTGKSALLFPKVLAELRKEPKNLPILKDYGAYAKEVKEAVQVEIRNYVRKTHKQRVPITDVQAYLKSKNLPNSLPIGFSGGLIDDLGNMYTREGRQLERNPIGVVRMNPNYNPETDDAYVLIGDEIGRVKTLTMNAVNQEKRFNRVKAFFAKETSFRKAWLADLDRANSKEQIFASMVELLYKTSCRIGGKANATKGEPTYGLTTLQVRHLTFHPDKVDFNYSGKKSHDQYHEFSTKTKEGAKIRKVLQNLVKDKDPDDLVFTYRGKPITDKNTNDYLKAHGIQITAHYFRRLTGTKLGMGILKMSPFKKEDLPKQAVVDKWVLEEFKKVGTVLHHNSGTEVTGKTALKSYVDPLLMADFFTGLGLRVPNFIPVPKKGQTTKPGE